jgi:hypothetical protein
VTSLQVTYDPDTAPLFQQLPLPTAPLVGLARLEVDGPDSLVALAPVLPQLVALTHLRASISLVGDTSDTHEALPSLQLCPRLRSLHLIMERDDDKDFYMVGAPEVQQLPVGLEELTIHTGRSVLNVNLHCGAIPRLTCLRRLSLKGLQVLVDGEKLFEMPVLEELDLRNTGSWRGDTSSTEANLLHLEACTAAHQRRKLIGMSLVQIGPNSGAAHTLVAVAPGVRKLAVTLMQPGAAGPFMQQLSGLRRMHHLEVFTRAPTADDLARVAALPSAGHLTCLCLHSWSEGVPRTTWAAVLPRLTQLRVLVMRKELLLEGSSWPRWRS